MANTPQALKRARQADKRHALRSSQRAQLRTYIKKTVYAVESGNKDAAREAYQAAVPVIDRLADKGVIHKNKAARHKSRLNARIKAMQ